jgi:hypothetical protein
LHNARGSAGNRGDKPLAFVVVAEKAGCFSLGRADEQEQMPVALVGLEHIHVERVAQGFGHAEFEKFTVTILLDVHGIIIRCTLRGRDADFEARTHHGEFGFNVIRIHMF